MARQDISVSELVSMVSRGELQLPEMQRQYVWRATRVRDLLDSLYRGYPSGLILAWRSSEEVATRDFAISTQTSESKTTMLLLDGQQRLTSLSAVLNGQPVEVRGRTKPVEILVNLEYELAQQRLTDQGLLDAAEEEDFEDEEELEEEVDDDGDESEEDEAPRSLDLEKRLFVVYSRALAGKRNWVRVSELFKKDNIDVLDEKGVDLKLETELAKAYIKVMDKVRKIKDYTYRIDVLDESMSYVEVTMGFPLGNPEDPRWIFDLAGGALMDLGCYAVHSLRTLGSVLGGEPTLHEASGVPAPHDERVDQEISATLSYPSGATAHFHSSFVLPKMTLTMDIQGSLGSAMAHELLLASLDDRISVTVGGEKRVENLGVKTSYAHQLEAFVAHVREGSPIHSDAQDAVLQAEFLDACYTAAGFPLRPLSVI